MILDDFGCFLMILDDFGSFLMFLDDFLCFLMILDDDFVERHSFLEVFCLKIVAVMT
jgi:hypothetical protein